MDQYRAKRTKKGQNEEKPKQAIALSYDPDEEAPRVIASGRGALAERIIERAQEADVPVHQDHKLADTLSRLEIGDMIPPELYEVVAEILVFVDAMDKIKTRAMRRKPYGNKAKENMSDGGLLPLPPWNRRKQGNTV